MITNVAIFKTSLGDGLSSFGAVAWAGFNFAKTAVIGAGHLFSGRFKRAIQNYVVSEYQKFNIICSLKRFMVAEEEFRKAYDKYLT
ncbi:unnamed protein product, partial [Didymodactylos carnosus]